MSYSVSMVDFIKTTVKNAYFIKDHALLDFKQKVNNKTAECESYREAEYDNMKFKLYEHTGLLFLKGSLHKFYNAGDHNHNDFSLSALKFTLDYLNEVFGIDLKNCALRNIEFGVNIDTGTKAKKVLNNLMLHRCQIFESGFKGHYRQARHAQYFVKVYDKSYQYRLNKQVLRYELKFIKMKKINQFGIYTLDDLKNDQWINAIEKLLAEEWGQLLLYDFTLSEKAFKQTDLLKWQNPNFWLGLSRMQKHREKKKYHMSVDRHSENIQNQNLIKINEKWNQLAKS